MSNAYSWLDKSLATIHRANWYRAVKAISGKPGAVVKLLDRSVVNFASNDYLGLAGDRRLAEAAIAAVDFYGTGSTGSRLLSGHRELHRKLELEIAAWKNTADALVFSSGYLANLGTVAALVGQRDLVLGDRYNHSSLKQGAVLSGATVLDYRHNDIEDLRAKLRKQRQLYRRCLITTDSVFSMDGDLCPLSELIAIATEFECMLLVDDAHATGVLGSSGAGSVEHSGCLEAELLQVGTLSKAVGSLGGYVAGSNSAIDYLRNRAASWIYTTALSPADTAAAIAGIKIIRQEPQRRTQLWDNISYLHQQLSDRDLMPSDSAIVCISLDSPQAALAQSQKLLEAGIFAPAIRPPTVPTSRIRLSLMATHQRQHLDRLAASL